MIVVRCGWRSARQSGRCVARSHQDGKLRVGRCRTVFRAEGIKKTYAGRGGLLSRAAVHALRGVDIEIPDRGSVALIGESGCGKTTLGRILAGYETADAGRIVHNGVDMATLPQRERRAHVRKVQLVQQDPYGALNPARTVGDQLRDPLRLGMRGAGRPGRSIDGRAQELLRLVGLDQDVMYRYPHQLSGGQRQRVVIARALTVDPEMLVADEAVSMIDVSLRLGILGVLRQLRRDLGLAILFITHDVAAARYIGEGTTTYVIYRGEVVERGPIDTLIEAPVHPYTQALLSALPVLRGLERPGRERYLAPVADFSEESEEGCLFHQRCPFAVERCRTTHPGLIPAPGDDHFAACFLPQVRKVVPMPLDAEDAGA